MLQIKRNAYLKYKIRWNNIGEQIGITRFMANRTNCSGIDGILSLGVRRSLCDREITFIGITRKYRFVKPSNIRRTKCDNIFIVNTVPEEPLNTRFLAEFE